MSNGKRYGNRLQDAGREKMVKLTSIRAKVLGLTGLAALCLLLIGSWLGVTAWQQHLQMQQAVSLMRLMQDAGALLSPLRMERGSTAGFLSSQGVSLTLVRDMARVEVNQHQEALQSWLTRPLPEPVADALTSTLQELSALEALRAQVDARSLPAGEAIGQYTRLADSLLLLMMRSTTTIGHGELAQMARPVMQWMHLEEAMGQERAILSKVLGANTPASMEAQSQWFQQRGRQELIQNILANVMPSDLWQQIMDMMMVDARHEVDLVRTQVREALLTGDYGVSVDHWFAVSTAKLGAMQQVRQTLIDRASTRAEALDRSSLWQLVAVTLLTAGLLVLVVWLGVRIESGVRQSYQRLGMALGQAGLAQPVQHESNDEFGQAARAFEAFRQTLVGSVSEMQQQAAHMGEELSLMRSLRTAFDHMADHDVLTGLYNRHHLDKRLPALLGQARLAQEPLTLVLLDVDGLRRVNALAGHHGGDMLLVALAGLMRQLTGEVDALLVRQDGDAFVLVLPGMGEEESAGRIEELRSDFVRLQARDGGMLSPVTLSAGMACFPHEAQSSIPLLARAEQALAQAKGQGGNRLVCLHQYEAAA